MKKIDEIAALIYYYPWNLVKAQVGVCDNLNVSLEGLTKADQTIREKSYWQLDNVIIVQGSLFEGAFYVIPFLKELLKVDDYFDANLLFELLFEIANGSADDVIQFSVIQEEMEYFIPSLKDGQIAPLSIMCRNEVLKGFYLYLKEFETNNFNSRERALDLMCSFTEHQYLIVTSIRSVCRNLKDEFLTDMAEKTIKDYYGDV